MASSLFSNKLVKRVIMIVDRASLVIPWHDVRFVLLSLVVACLVNQGLLKQRPSHGQFVNVMIRARMVYVTLEVLLFISLLVLMTIAKVSVINIHITFI